MTRAESLAFGKLSARMAKIDAELRIHREAIGCLICGLWQDAAVEMKKLNPAALPKRRSSPTKGPAK